MRFATGIVGGIIVLALVLGGSASGAQAATTADLTAQINALLAQIQALQAQLGTTQGTSMSLSLTRDLTVGSRGADVTSLQNALGVSPATGYFGPITRAAVAKYQSDNGISPAVGYVGPKTRAALNSMSVTSTPTTTTTTTVATTPVVPAGTAALAVSIPAQPGVSLAPQGASRVPFTKVTLTAGASDVTVNSFLVERTGLAQDAVFGGIVVLDENGNQLGTAKTLNSNHQVTVGDAFVVRAGSSRTMTIAGNMGSSLSSYAGQVASLTINQVNTSATVSGPLPITGAGQTINSSLTLGTVTVAVSQFDPNSAVSYPIGTTGLKMAGVKITAGSAEQVKLISLRWNQSGSAAIGDLANVMTYVDGVAYPVMASSDGKYLTANFGSGILIDKGFSKDVYIQGDIVGSGAASRTIQFDIYKTTDVYLLGNTYGYGITPPAGTGSSSTATTITAANPWFDASQITINAGTVTSISKSTSVPATNIAVNVANQPLGGFDTDIKGEPITIASLLFTVASTTGSGYGLLTSVSLVDQNGAVVAGPVDGVYSDSTHQTLTFTDTVTFPTGKRTYQLKGKVASTIGNGGTYITSFTPSTGFTTVTGQTTGNTVSLSALSTAVALNTMTVKSAALAINVASTPVAQTIVSGGSRTFTNYQLDATQSGEDVRLSSMPLDLTYANSGAGTDLTACALYDGTTQLNTGSNVVNPTTTASVAPYTFTFDTALTVPKLTVKTLALKCNVSSAAASGATYSWGMTNAHATGLTVTGVTSSNSVTSTNGTGGSGALTGSTMTIGAGTLTVALDASSPSYQVVAAGTSGVTTTVLKFHAANENINLARVVLRLTNTASSSPTDLSGANGTPVSLWYNGSQIGTASFTGTNSVATSTLTTPVMIPKDGDALVTVKVDLNPINNSSGVAGHLLAVDYFGSDSTGTYGTGSESGVTRNSGSASTAASGVRIQRAYPVFDYSTTGGAANNGVNDLLTLNVSAVGGEVFLNKLTFAVSTTTATFSSPTFSGPTGNVSSTTNSTIAYNGSATTATSSVTVWFDSTSNTSDAKIGAGQTKSYTLRGTLALTGNTNTTGSISIALTADVNYPILNTTSSTGAFFMASTSVATLVNGLNGTYPANIIWSPESTTSSVTTAYDDWTNGYGLGGCFSRSGLGQNCTSRTVSK